MFFYPILHNYHSITCRFTSILHILTIQLNKTRTNVNCHYSEFHATFIFTIISQWLLMSIYPILPILTIHGQWLFMSIYPALHILTIYNALIVNVNLTHSPLLLILTVRNVRLLMSIYPALYIFTIPNQWLLFYHVGPD